MIDLSERSPKIDLPLEPGTAVEVANNFDGGWTQGFRVERITENGYVVTRVSDGAQLPEFPFDEVRTERRKRDMWWY